MIKRALIAVATVAVLGLCAIGILGPRIEQRLLQPPTRWPGGKYALVEVKEGATASDTTQELLEQGLIRSARAFKALLKRQDWEGKIKPGLYKIEPGSGAEQIARKLINQDTWQIRVTIPEGLRLKQIAARIEQAGRIEGGQWLPTADQIMAAATAKALRKSTGLRIPTASAEGYLFPATYEFQAGASAAGVVGSMFGEFADRFTGRFAEEIERSKLSAHELVTLASIIEREAEADRERPLIAQVFINRLEKGMKLESCATVQYALPKHKSRLLYADLRVDSPYNTYVHRGLPPGPICSPGEPSLMAALRPKKTDALYFVSKGDGTHRFARTFAEHQENIRRVRGG